MRSTSRFVTMYFSSKRLNDRNASRAIPPAPRNPVCRARRWTTGERPVTYQRTESNRAVDRGPGLPAEVRDDVFADVADGLELRPLGHRPHLAAEQHLVDAGLEEPPDVPDAVRHRA